MAVISASCSLEAHLAIGAQDYVATDYVAVGYIEHSIESEVVRFIDASVTLSSTATVAVTANSILDATVPLTATVTTVVTAQETPEQAQASISGTANLSVSAGAIRQGTTTLTSNLSTQSQANSILAGSTTPSITASVVCRAGEIFTTSSTMNIVTGITVAGTVRVINVVQAQASLSATTTTTVDADSVLPYNIYGRPVRFGTGSIRRASDEPFKDAYRNIVRQGNTIEFINSDLNTYLYMPGSEFQIPLSSTDPWTLEFRLKVNDPEDSSSISAQIPQKIFEYYNSADTGVYLRIYCRTKHSSEVDSTNSKTFFDIGYTFSDSGATDDFLNVFQETEKNMETWLHIALTYDGNQGDSSGTAGRPHLYVDGRYVKPPTFLFEEDSTNAPVPVQWEIPSHSTSEWRFGDVDLGFLDDNHYHIDDIRLTKGVLYSRDPRVPAESSYNFVPPGGGTFSEIDAPPGSGASYQWTYDNSDGGLELGIDSNTVFLVNGNNELITATATSSSSASVTADISFIATANINISSTSTATITAIETPEQASTTIASTLTTTASPRVDFKGTVNLASTSTVSVTAEEVLEQAQVNISSTLTTAVQSVRQRLNSVSIPTTSTVSVTAVEIPEQTSTTLTIDSNLNINAGLVGEGDAPLTITSSLTVTGTVGLTVVIQNIPIDAASTLTVSGDRIRLSSTSIPSTATVTASAEELLEQAEINVPITSTVTAVNTRLRNTSVSITSTPGLTVNTIPNVFRILGANTLIIPRQTRTLAIDAQDKTLLIPQQDRLNIVNKQTRILPIPQQTRVLEIEQ